MGLLNNAEDMTPQPRERRVTAAPAGNHKIGTLLLGLFRDGLGEVADHHPNSRVHMGGLLQK